MGRQGIGRKLSTFQNEKPVGIGAGPKPPVGGEQQTPHPIRRQALGGIKALEVFPSPLAAVDGPVAGRPQAAGRIHPQVIDGAVGHHHVLERGQRHEALGIKPREAFVPAQPKVAVRGLGD